MRKNIFTKILEKLIYNIFFLVLIFSTTASLQAAPIRFVVLNIFGVEQTFKIWGDVKAYLEQQSNEKIRFIPVTNLKIAGYLRKLSEKNDVAVLLANPVISLQAHNSFKTEIIGTLEKSNGPVFAGVIIARADSGLRTLQDIEERPDQLTVAAVNTKRAAGGYLFQMKLLKDAGIPIDTHFKKVVGIGNQNNIVSAVKAGVYDLGFIRDGTLEKNIKKKNFKKGELVVINKQNGKVARSTPFYPHWGIALFNANKNPTAMGKLKKAILELKEDTSPQATKAKKAARIKGFLPVIDHGTLKTLLVEFNLEKLQ